MGQILGIKCKSECGRQVMNGEDSDRSIGFSFQLNVHTFRIFKRQTLFSVCVIPLLGELRISLGKKL